MILEIEKGVPIPETLVRKTKYKFSDMEIGDSFWSNESKNRIMAAAIQWSKRHNPDAKFRTADDVNDGKHGVRIWRVS